MFSQYGHGQAQRLSLGRVPLPHEDQAHFYGAPPLDFGTTGAQGGADTIAPGEGVYFCGFDTLDGTGDVAASGVENVLICGFEGGLEVYHISHDGAQLIGVLENLKGAIISAKLLKSPGRDDPLGSIRPLIAVVTHGPILETPSKGDRSNPSDQAVTESPQALPNLSRSEEISRRVTSYQTSVEVFSLADRKLKSTLYTAPAVLINVPVVSSEFEPPAPSPITIDSCGKFVVVAIGGRSGEVYIFSPNTRSSQGDNQTFKCLGKLWTSIRVHKQQNDSSTISTPFHTDHENTDFRSRPVFSLSHRWLALTPPQTSAQFSLYGAIADQGDRNHIPGLTVSMSPPPPSINCAVDTPDERFMSRMSRMAAKNLAKGANWASNYGKQLWKQYVGQQSGSTTIDVLDPVYQADPMSPFPPTHANHDTLQSSEGVPVVAIYDLHHLLAAFEKRVKVALHPEAVFEQALGCSFLSFAPSGLHLMTVSRDGDTQVLWDLKRICYGRSTVSGPRGSAVLGPHVREITRITRVTDASVVDVIWGAPKDEKLAVLTDKGTLHVHIVSSSSLQWPPLWRLPRHQHSVHNQSGSGSGLTKLADTELSSPSARSRLNSAYDAVNGATSWLSSIGSRGLNNNTNLPSLSSLSFASAAGAKSAKAAATNAGKAIGQGVLDIKHAADNKIYLRPSGLVEPRCAIWMTGDSRGLIATVSTGDVKMFKVRSIQDHSRANLKETAKRVVLKPVHMVHLQGLPSHRIAPAILRTMEPSGPTSTDGREATTHIEPCGMWQPALSASPSEYHNDRRSSERTMWKSYAELQTTSPYSKFHTDPRVSLFVYIDGQELSASSSRFDNRGNEQLADPHHPSTNEPWIFGGKIATTKISTGAVKRHDAIAGIIQGKDDADGFVWHSARSGEGQLDGSGFFEDDADVIDLAEDRV